MSVEQELNNTSPPEDPHDEPKWDIEAARARYRRQMRSRPMRLLGVFTVVVILLSWAFAVAAAYGPDVADLPGHDLTVLPETCISCHTRQSTEAPPMSHPAAPSCGFCHLQGLPPVTNQR